MRYTMDLQSSLLLQLIKSLNGEDTLLPDSPEPPIPLEPPLDILFKLRPILNPREQKVIDLMIKIQEIMALIDELHTED